VLCPERKGFGDLDCDHEHRICFDKPATVTQQSIAFLSPEGRLMLDHELRTKILARLTNARCELEDALQLSIPAARYDPIVIPEPLRNRLPAMIDDLKGVLRQIEGSQ
jgi:hypothetical protein